MLNEAKLPDTFCWQVVSKTIYILNREKIRVNNKKTSYELWKSIPTIVKYFKLFWSKCYIKINEDNLKNIDSRIYETIFPPYASRKKAYKFYNKRLHKVLDSIVVRVDEMIPQKEKSHTNEDP